jgi:uncharacterized RDD family membrane protein YckC
VTAPAATSDDPARLGRRLLSLAYEALLLAAVWLAGGFAFTALAGHLEPHLARPALQVVLVLLAGVYFVWQWRLGGQTLPMKTWHIRLVTTTGKPLSLRHALWRFVLAVAGTLLLGIGFLWAFVDPDRQFLHDRLAGTRIVMSDE